MVRPALARAGSIAQEPSPKTRVLIAPGRAAMTFGKSRSRAFCSAVNNTLEAFCSPSTCGILSEETVLPGTDQYLQRAGSEAMQICLFLTGVHGDAFGGGNITSKLYCVVFELSQIDELERSRTADWKPHLVTRHLCASRGAGGCSPEVMQRQGLIGKSLNSLN